MDVERLRRNLPSNDELYVGHLPEMIPAFLGNLTPESAIGFVAIDVDYYSSTVDALAIFNGHADQYLPIVCTYLDDIAIDASSESTGELLAVKEFNEKNTLRKIAPFTLLRSKRLFSRAQWIDRMYACHIHDHKVRTPDSFRPSSKSFPTNFFINSSGVARPHA